MARTPLVRGGKIDPKALKGVDHNALSDDLRGELGNVLNRSGKGGRMKADDINVLADARRFGTTAPSKSGDVVDSLTRALNAARGLTK